MGEKLTFHKLVSEKNYTIEIPIIQRDYAQGRESAREIRDQFLVALRDYLNGDESIELDFIYGSIIANGENNLFTPLDGQQRLTTLFLLHWYLAVKENRLSEFRDVLLSNGKGKFSYETRVTSRDFCYALVLNDFNFADLSSRPISELISDSSWFFLSWKNDPTIKSMLVVIDAIHQVFSDSKGFYDKLVNNENPIICFQFIELKDFGLTDSLYVKMNSRGKELTEFENFKAKFEQYIDKLDQKNGTDVKTEFSKKIDTDWTDLFWNYCKDDETKVFDSQLMNFIRVLVINNHALKEHNKTIEKNIGILSNKSQKISFNQYEKANLLDKNCLQDIKQTLDFLKNDSNKVKTFLAGKNLINESEMFEKAIQNSLSLSERIIFFAYYKYLIVNKGDTSGLYDWMRIIRNLSVNSNYDIERYMASIKAVSRLLPSSADILNFLSNPNSKIDGFAEIQIREERIKATLLLKSDEWRKSIISYENHKYFVGQVDFLLKFAGIKDYYESNSHLDWTDDENVSFFESFNEYGDKAAIMFSDSGLNGFGEYLWERALLSKGDYSLFHKRNKCFLIDGNDRDISWKRLLRNDNEKRNYLKSLFDEINVETVKEDLQSIIENANCKDWRKYFIKRPEILDVCGINKFVRFDFDNDRGILLLKKSQTNGVHREYYSFALKVELENLGNRIGYYHPTNSVWENSAIYLINGKSITIEYSYIGNNYHLKLDSEQATIKFKTEQEVITYLFENNFINKKSE